MFLGKILRAGYATPESGSRFQKAMLRVNVPVEKLLSDLTDAVCERTNDNAKEEVVINEAVDRSILKLKVS